MIKLTNEQLAKYWRDIPNDDEIINAIKNADFDTWPVQYTDLCEKWHCSARRVRDILAALSWYDNGDYARVYNTEGRRKVDRKPQNIVGTIFEKEIFCANCGKKITSAQRFCEFCGKENIYYK